MNNKSSSSETGAEQVHWDLSDLYLSPGDPELINDRKRVVDEAERFAKKYRGRVSGLSKVEFLSAIREYEEIIQKLRKIGSYSHLKWTVNTEDPELGKLMQQANELGSEISQKLVFFDVEWLKVNEDVAGEYIGSEELKPYKHYLRVSRLYKSHTLDEGQEQVMSAKNVTGRSAWNRYFDETMGSARFELDGEVLTQQQVLSKLQSGDRDLRKRAHESMTQTLDRLKRTLTYIFNTLLADKAANDKLRGYKNWIDSRNLANQTDEDSVNALVKSVQDSYPLVQRYYRLKCDLLGYDSMYDYDRYAPMIQSEKTIQWGEAREMVLDAYSGFDPEMGNIAGIFFDNNWIDAAIRPGKRGGAYSASTVTTVHPYVFMNFDGRIRDVQTLAHELGHGVHQYLSGKQGELQSSTPLTTAETASVFGEMLVFEKLMENLDDPKEKLSLLVSKIDDTIATVFRQISMNRFEDAIHNARRDEGEMTTDQFAEKWIRTQTDLYGDAVVLTDEYRLWWSYIPHFLHTPGYVYAYAFGELLVLALYQSYKKNSTGFSKRYLKMLEAGGSDWPHKLVSGLDMNIKDPTFWHNGLKIFEQMIEEAEELKREVILND
jgi:oligoendopeptidase F